MSLAIAYGMKKKAKKMAEGGIAGSDPEADKYDTAMDGDDMMADGGIVDRVMKARCMSKGGMVANDTSMESPDAEDNQFDDLVLRDDLESSYTGENSGDEIGADDADIVSRVMRSRKRPA